MAVIGYSVLILGLVVASAIADEATTLGSNVYSSTSSEYSTSKDEMPSINPTSPNPDTSSPLSTSDMSTINMSMPSTTSEQEKGGKMSPKSPITSSTTPKPYSASEGRTPTKATTRMTTATKPPTTGKSKVNDNAGIIIMVVIILVAVGFLLACLLARRRGRRYSVDFASRPDEANIPLSTVEPVEPADVGSQNGLQTFQSEETSTKEPQEQAAEPEVKEEQNAEADKSVDDATAESAVPAGPTAEATPAAPAPDSSESEDKPKADVLEQTPDAPVQQSMEEKTDDEGVVSNQTSVESLKETNENNSNSTVLSQRRGLELSKVFWDVALDSPV